MIGSPKVSVHAITYNHERYIAQGVHSALTQQTTFPFEIVVGEDCSTDGTLAILKDLERTHPDRIRLLARKPNVGAAANFRQTLAECRGEYVALLEGDDYWTDPHKLQKQVEALDAHPDWSMCFHTARCLHEDGSASFDYPVDWPKEVSTFTDLLETNFIATCSVVFRNRLFPSLPAWHSNLKIGDWALHLLNAEHGDIGYLRETMAVYRVHPRGLWSSGSHSQKLRAILEMWSTVDEHFERKYSRQIDRCRLALIDEYVKAMEESYSYRIGRAITQPVARVLHRVRPRNNRNKK